MTKAQEVTRIVKGPKPIHAYDTDGKKRIYAVGETVSLPPHAAKTFARYLTTPELAKAEAAVKVAEAAAAAEAAEIDNPKVAEPEKKPAPEVKPQAAKPAASPTGKAPGS